MWRDSVSRRGAAIVLGISFLFQLCGCASWSVQKAPPAQVLTQKSCNVVRLTLSDGNRVQVFGPRLVDDSLEGYTGGASTERQSRPISVPLSDIRDLEIRSVDTGKTVLLATGIGVTILLVAAIAAVSSTNWSSTSPMGSGNFSCPFIYSWDGHQWRLDSGTFGGAIMPALQRTDLDNLIHAAPSAGTLPLKLANELRETDYVDAVSILAVDHPPGTRVLPDAGGLPVLHAVRAPDVPLSARDEAGRERLAWVRASDGVFWESDLRPRDAASPTDVTDGLELAFRKPVGAARATLVLDVRNTPWASYLMGHLVRSWGRDVAQWYDPATSPLVARRLGAALADKGFLAVQVRVNGRWETRGRVWETGPEVAKQVAMPLDLAGVAGEEVEVRLESIPNFWLVDCVGLDSSPPAPFSASELALETAIEHRGTDVRDQLAARDGAYFIMARGDAADLTVKVPPVPAGMERSYLAKTAGWYRIEGAESAPPDTALIAEVNAPGGPARAAVRLSNRALASLR
jgi:hypothetical protein